ncbi:MAG: threonine ammonia-lyase [Methanobacteriota archaeon]
MAFALPTMAEIREAEKAIRGIAWRTPLVPASRDEDGKVYLKLECLQRLGSFKIRGAWNRMRETTTAERRQGFQTTSAGNHGQAVAWTSRKLGAPCTVWVPETAVERKVRSMESMGATVRRMPHSVIMEAMTDDRFANEHPVFVHPFGDTRIVAGQGTIGLEILEDLPEAKTVLVPVGGGGLSTGIANALRASGSKAKVYGVQAEGAAPLPRSFAEGRPVDVGRADTFADGMGASRVFPYMWPHLSTLLSGAFAVSDRELEQAIRHLATESHVVVEGAGAAALAAARRYRDRLEAPIVCVASGGNLAPERLLDILK